MDQKTIELPEVIDEVEVIIPCRVFLFNDVWHTYDEFIVQLMKAIRCTFTKAQGFAFEVHNNGKAMVFSGSLNECLRVSSVLEEIALHTQIVSDF